MKKHILLAMAILGIIQQATPMGADPEKRVLPTVQLTFLTDPENPQASSSCSESSSTPSYTIKDIGKENIKSFAHITEPKIPFTTGGKVKRFIERQRQILLNNSIKKICSTAFEIINNVEKSLPAADSIIDQATWQDLNLLSGSDKNPEIYLGSIIDHTQTALGKAFLLSTIARPITHIAVLKNRQEIVKTLVKTPALLELLDECLSPMTEGEKQLFSFWGRRFALPGTIFKQYWTINDKFDQRFNNSALALDIKSAWTNTQKCMGTAIQATSTVLLTAYGLCSLYYSFVGTEQTPETLQSLEDYAKRFTGTAGPVYAVVSAIDPTLQSSAALLAGIVNGLSLKSSIAWTKADMSIEAILQNKFVPIARMIQQMKQIYEKSKNNPTLFARFENFENLARCIKSSKLKPLFDVLESNTFSEESNYFFRRGNMLLACKLLQDKTVRTELEKGLTALAEIDMYVSIAKLFKKQKDAHVKFCFPTYLEDKNNPMIELKEFWNPFVDPTVVVKNSITLGSKNQNRNAIITGPNSAGKTTAVKNIALALILGQSIGITPAENMIFTPFDHIATYMDISDDISNKTSLFQAEVDRAIKLHRTIRTSALGSFSFCMFDELFSGTSPDEGKAIAYATAQAIGKLPNSICMIATHYTLLTQLARKTDCFTNYKVGVEPGTLKRLYKLQPGISDQHIALDVARERGTKGEILNLASRILKESSL